MQNFFGQDMSSNNMKNEGKQFVQNQGIYSRGENRNKSRQHHLRNNAKEVSKYMTRDNFNPSKFAKSNMIWIEEDDSKATEVRKSSFKENSNNINTNQDKFEGPRALANKRNHEINIEV
mmetsp:Transcript_13602/g.13345  ORF Transcript_13602/g.13345 Transcript_13602/m.13345 type:complete len:119 (+) Transcript_13602:1166-1522(+)|eukprot:CAMPEP_0170553050 /NCGR_PEP_ID=MMETSP0211-20121228/10917_1 /TAXON_ID=311385 /ORGANISM="Pseudokeronopsis sp., Strain OXSARD2" /LENGTH=118 /DNA_ID=CAMNT_0010861175 /DNA_START=1087 /DNA_END=1443 /DNA_ORIENTATION=+